MERRNGLLTLLFFIVAAGLCLGLAIGNLFPFAYRGWPVVLVANLISLAVGTAWLAYMIWKRDV